MIFFGFLFWYTHKWWAWKWTWMYSRQIKLLKTSLYYYRFYAFVVHDKFSWLRNFPCNCNYKKISCNDFNLLLLFISCNFFVNIVIFLCNHVHYILIVFWFSGDAQFKTFLNTIDDDEGVKNASLYWHNYYRNQVAQGIYKNQPAGIIGDVVGVLNIHINAF